MLSDNIRSARRAKGLSQEELAIKLNVVRQTVSKWENGLSVPDAALLISLAEALDTTVSALLGEEAAAQSDVESVASLGAKLELLNEQFAHLAERRRLAWLIMSLALLVIALLFAALELAPVLYSEYITPSVSADIGIIGGADGPTSILVASSDPDIIPLIAAFIAILLAVIGICRFRRKS